MKVFAKDQGDIKKDNYTAQSENIPLINVLEHADKMMASLVEAKVKEVMRTGRDIKSVLLGEGLPPTKYQGFLKQIERITGKGIRDIKNSL